MTDVVRPEWLVPGAEVVVFTAGSPIPRNAKRTTIHRVAAQSFTVDGSDVRFKLTTQEYHQRSGAWGFGWTRRVVPANSIEGRRELAVESEYRLECAARDACETWTRERTRENRLAAIAALQAIDEE